MREEIGETLKEIVELMILQELRELRESLNEEEIVFPNGARATFNKAGGEAFKSRGISGVFPPPQFTMDTTPIEVAENRARASRGDKKRRRLSETEKKERKSARAREWYSINKERLKKQYAEKSAGRRTSAKSATAEEVRQKAAMKAIAETRSSDEVY